MSCNTAWTETPWAKGVTEKNTLCPTAFDMSGKLAVFTWKPFRPKLLNSGRLFQERLPHSGPCHEKLSWKAATSAEALVHSRYFTKSCHIQRKPTHEKLSCSGCTLLDLERQTLSKIFLTDFRQHFLQLGNSFPFLLHLLCHRSFLRVQSGSAFFQRLQLLGQWATARSASTCWRSSSSSSLHVC